MCTIKTLLGVDAILAGGYKIRAEGGLEMFKNYTRQSYQLLTIHNGGCETYHTICRAMYTKTNKENRPAPSHGTQLCNAYPLQIRAAPAFECSR